MVPKPSAKSRASKLSKNSKSIKKQGVKKEAPSLKPTVKKSAESRRSGASGRNKTSLTAAEKAELAKLDVENMRPDRTRRRKTKAETRVLEEEFQKSHEWTFEQKCRIALRLRMSATQVSKWLWERKKLEKGPKA